MKSDLTTSLKNIEPELTQEKSHLANLEKDPWSRFFTNMYLKSKSSKWPGSWEKSGGCGIEKCHNKEHVNILIVRDIPILLPETNFRPGNMVFLADVITIVNESGCPVSDI
jgi:hypothetical protein